MYFTVFKLYALLALAALVPALLIKALARDKEDVILVAGMIVCGLYGLGGSAVVSLALHAEGNGFLVWLGCATLSWLGCVPLRLSWSHDLHMVTATASSFVGSIVFTLGSGGARQLFGWLSRLVGGPS